MRAREIDALAVAIADRMSANARGRRAGAAKREARKVAARDADLDAAHRQLRALREELDKIQHPEPHRPTDVLDAVGYIVQTVMGRHTPNRVEVVESHGVRVVLLAMRVSEEDAERVRAAVDTYSNGLFAVEVTRAEAEVASVTRKRRKA